MTEKELIERAQHDRRAFGVIYEAHFEGLFRFVLKRVSDRQLTSDLVSQTFVKAMLSLNTYTYTGVPIKAWLYRIAINEVNMYFRENKRVHHVQLSESLISGLSQELEESGIRQMQFERVVASLNTLEEQEVLLIELRFFEGMRFREMAEVLGSSEDAVKMKTHRVLKRLKSVILTQG
ncbi:MAG: sigma-70 family RNA polymerase sigma factor [Flavobacteriales bacterium]|nr:sigma-70 family RNA polymerase sigma factor [Flavobacteriales bacterium]